MDTLKVEHDGARRDSILRIKASRERQRSYSIFELRAAEQGLDDEIRREDAESQTKQSTVQRMRHKGSLVLHSKHILMMVVLLNLIDCILVLGVLILDIHYVGKSLTEEQHVAQDFINNMESRYPAHLYGHTVEEIDLLYIKLYQAECQWSRASHVTSIAPSVSTNADQSVNAPGDGGTRRRRAEGELSDAAGGVAMETGADSLLGNSSTNGTGGGTQFYQHHMELENHEVIEAVAHGLHKASIVILAILAFETLLKLICMGSHFFHKKLEVFDGFVVVVSFILDLVFLKGIVEFPVQDGLFILSFLVPWRVIRVVNSLIVAVLDHEHFRLKMIYREKKMIEAECSRLKDLEKGWKFHLKKIEGFCESEGIPLWKIRQHTAMQHRQTTVSSMASFALSGMVNNMLLDQSDKKSFHAKINRSISQVAEESESTEEGTPNVKAGNGCVNKAYTADEGNLENDTKDTVQANGKCILVNDKSESDGDERNKQLSHNGDTAIGNGTGQSHQEDDINFSRL